MKTLKTTDNGGFPFELDDLRWIADGLSETLEMAGNVIGDNFVIDGVVPTITPSGGDLDVTHTAGKVFFDGEFCEVDALSIPLTWISGDECWFEKDVTFDPSGNETFEDASVHDTYKIVKVKLATGATIPSGGISLVTFVANANRVPKLIVDKIVNEKIIMNERVQFKNAATATTATNITDGGVFEFEDSSNAEIVEFTSPVVDLIAIDNGSASLSGQWKIVKFVGVSGSTQIEIIHQSTGTVGGRFKIKTKDGINRIVKSGETCLFWNDGSSWVLVLGGTTKNIVRIPLTLVGGWSNTIGSVANYTKNDDGLVKMSGAIQLDPYTTTVDDLVGTIPAGFRPTQNELFCVRNFTGLKDVCYLEIAANGEVRITELAATADQLIFSLSVVSYYATQ